MPADKQVATFSDRVKTVGIITPESGIPITPIYDQTPVEQPPLTPLQAAENLSKARADHRQMIADIAAEHPEWPPSRVKSEAANRCRDVGMPDGVSFFNRKERRKRGLA